MNWWNRFLDALLGGEGPKEPDVSHRRASGALRGSGAETRSASRAASRGEHGGVAVLSRGTASETQDVPCGEDVRAPAFDASSTEQPRAWWTADEGAPTEYVAPARPGFCAEARAFEQRLISHFDGHDLNIPPLAQAAERVLRRLRDPKCGMDDVANDLADDQVSAAEVLRIANSALYRGVNKITSLQAAVTRLGVGALRTLMLHQSMKAAAFPKNADAHELARALWRRSLASACTMRELARLLALDVEDAFVTGLLHDIGGVLTLRIAFEPKSGKLDWLDDEAFEYLRHESHQEFGELIAQHWQLPPTLAALIANHHDAPDADDPLRVQRWMLIFAEMVNQTLGYAPGQRYDLKGSQAARALGLAQHPGFAHMLDALPRKIEENAASLE